MLAQKRRAGRRTQYLPQEVIQWQLKGNREVPGEMREGSKFAGKGNSKNEGSVVGICMASTKRRMHRIEMKQHRAQKCGLCPGAGYVVGLPEGKGK